MVHRQNPPHRRKGVRGGSSFKREGTHANRGSVPRFSPLFAGISVSPPWDLHCRGILPREDLYLASLAVVTVYVRLHSSMPPPNSAPRARRRRNVGELHSRRPKMPTTAMPAPVVTVCVGVSFKEGKVRPYQLRRASCRNGVRSPCSAEGAAPVRV